MQAQAAVAIAPRQVTFQTITVPDPTSQDVVIRVTHSWISNGTEGSFVRGERIAGDTPRAPEDPLPFPHVPGYQKVGIVEHIGIDVPDIEVGDTVFATVSHVSGMLYSQGGPVSQSGEIRQVHRTPMFYSHGGHVSPAVTHRSQVWRLPVGVDPVAFSGLVLTQVGYNVGMRPTLQPGDAVVVIGDGMVGHWAAQTYQHRGARVLMLGKHKERLSLLSLADGDRVVNVQHEYPLEAARAWATEGVQVVADTVGSIPTIEALLPVMRHDSHIVSAGFYGPNGRIDIQKLRDREITLHAPAGWSRPRLDATLALVAQGILKTKPLITHHFPAAQAGDAFDLILSRREPVLGVILDWE
jgi:2-desacetyl-2-hydroxyethyl bacteriochlorophyllide A dehydrogenase